MKTTKTTIRERKKPYTYPFQIGIRLDKKLLDYYVALSIQESRSLSFYGREALELFRKAREKEIEIVQIKEKKHEKHD